MHASDLTRHVPAEYSALIAQMKFYIEPEISCSRFFAEACFTEESLKTYRHKNDGSVLQKTELGETLSKRLEDATFVDIPCGLTSVRDQERDWDLIPLLSTLGAKECWEVDFTAEVIRDRVLQTRDVISNGSYQLMNGIETVGTREQDRLKISTMQDDLLGFLSKIPDAHQPLTIYISALQPNAELCKDAGAQRDIIIPYLNALFDELHRICRLEDTIILNSAAMLVEGIDEEKFPMIHPAVALGQRGFDLLRRCQYNKVNIFARSH